MIIRTNAKEVAGGLEAYQVTVFKSIYTALTKSMEIIERAAEAYIQKHDIIASGSLISSITSIVRRLTDQLIGEVGTNMKHGIFVHEGTRPHWPPRAPIERWVALKARRGVMDVQNIRSVAFLIARAISRRGTKAQPFLAVALRLNQQSMVQRVAKAINAVNPSAA